MAVPVASRRAGQEIAARVAVRLDAGIVSDVIDIRLGDEGPVAVRSVLDGSYPVEPIVRDVDVPVPDRRGAARLVPRVPMDAVHRPDREAQLNLLAEIRRRRSTSTPRSATRRNR